MAVNTDEIIRENEKRNKDRKEEEERYDPVTGAFCQGERRHVHIADAPIEDMWLTEEMLADETVSGFLRAGSLRAYMESQGVEYSAEVYAEVWMDFCRIRYYYDFEFWAIMTVMINPKEGGDDVPFRLNRPQRRLLARFETKRLAGEPIRLLVLKARQWGGSTLTQIYMAWMQLIRHKNWHSVICAHVERAARTIRGMYGNLMKYYPAYLLDSTNNVKLLPYQGSPKTVVIKNRDCRITIGSAEKPDGVRGENISMAHISEYGLWKKTEGKSPEDVMQSITGGLLDKPETMIVIESTAKGVGTSFHRDWIAAVKGESSYDHIFIAWFDIELYAAPIDDVEAFARSLTPYEMHLFMLGATLEAISWMRSSKKAMRDEWRFKSEYPSFPEEAFQSTGHRVFDVTLTERMRKNVMPPLLTGELMSEAPYGERALENISFEQRENGCLKVWALPDKTEKISNRYCVSVDIGGYSRTSDYSVASVFDRYYMMEPGGVPELVAQWRGHMAHYMFAWMSAIIAKYYNNALLVFESNTLEKEKNTEGNHLEYVLDEISGHYNNLYCRTSAEQIRAGLPPVWGFQTNHKTKTLLVDHQIKMLSTDGYVERDMDAVFEHEVFEVKENGTFGAVEGNHDDIVMSRAIGTYVCYDIMRFPLPAVIKAQGGKRPRARQFADIV